MEETSFVKQMSEMKEKADKYEHQKQRYEQAADKLQEIMNNLSNVINDLKPSIKIRSYITSGRRKGKNDDIISYAIRYMETGKYLSCEELLKAFPDRNVESIKQVFYVVLTRNNKQVLKTKIDNVTKLYMLKN